MTRLSTAIACFIWQKRCGATALRRRPPHGWPHWCEEQLRPENADFVLLICTTVYCDRVENKVVFDEGRGAFWEGSIIYDYVYEEKGNQRFIPLLLDGATKSCIPRPIRNHTHYAIGHYDFTDRGLPEALPRTDETEREAEAGRRSRTARVDVLGLRFVAAARRRVAAVGPRRRSSEIARARWRAAPP